MITFNDIYLNINLSNINKLYKQLESLSEDENIENLYFVDHFSKLQSEKEFLNNEIFFELIETEEINPFKYFDLLYKYKSFINNCFSNCSTRITNFVKLGSSSIADIIGVTSDQFLVKAEEIEEFITSSYTERILDLSFADRIETILISKKYKSIMFICGFSCAIYIFDKIYITEIEKLVQNHNLFLWKKTI